MRSFGEHYLESDLKRKNGKLDETMTSLSGRRRALQELVGKHVVAQARYFLLGEVADTAYLSELLKRNLKTTDVSRLRYVMEEVQSECGKLGAARTPGLLEFLETKLNHKDPNIRELTVGSLRCLVSRLDDAKKEEQKIVQAHREEIRFFLSRLGEEGRIRPSP